MSRAALALAAFALSACRVEVREVASTHMKACALYADDRIRCWGQLESGDELIPGEPLSRDLEIGEHIACALQVDGTPACWGADASAGTGTPDQQLVDVGVGETMACGVRPDGSLTCWGCAERSRFAPRECLDEDRYGRLTPPPGEFISVACRRHCCAVRADGAAVCWGEATIAPPPTRSFIDVRVAVANQCGVADDGEIICWQERAGGVATAGPPAGSFRKIDVQFRHGCGVRDDRALECWGEDDDDGKTVPPAGAFVDVAVGTYNSCGVNEEREVQCWGSPFSGVLDLPE